MFGLSNEAGLKEAIDAGAYLVDVRTHSEFAQGHPKGAVNIPLNLLAGKAQQLKSKGTIVVFCQSGMRSSQAKQILTQQGITQVIDGGSWTHVRKYTN